MSKNYFRQYGLAGLLALFFSFISIAVLLSTPAQAQPRPDKDYQVLPQKQAAINPTPGKIEVIEFFWYECPHCNAFDPIITDWVNKNAAKISFVRIPVAFKDSFVPQQRMFYALDAMGKLTEMHPKIFKAIHTDQQKLSNQTEIVAFTQKNNIDSKQFTELYNSFGVQVKTRWASQMQEKYKVQGVPTIAINGQYVTSPGMAGGYQEVIQVMTHLLNTSTTADTNHKKAAKK